MAEFPQTTAELVIRAAEAAHILGPEASTDDIAEFLGGSSRRARDALTCGLELGCVSQGQSTDHWKPTKLAATLAAATPFQKTVLLRVQLEDYAPYVLFRNRLIAGEAPREAARQTCIAHSLSTDPIDVEETLLNLGAFSGGLSYGNNRELIVEVNPALRDDLAKVHARIATDRATVQAHIIERLGPDATASATGEVLDSLTDSYLAILKGESLTNAMFHLGKALEAWVKRLAANNPPVAVPANAKTLGSVAQALRQARRTTSKHDAILRGIIAVRNAADHAVDPDIGATWGISEETAYAVSHLTWSLMRSFFASAAGDHTL